MKKSAFTLIEILVVLAIFAVIATLTAFAGVDFYKAYVFRAEKYNLVSILQKARSLSLANINQKPHGVYIDSNGYTIFSGNSYSSGASDNLFFASGGSVSHTNSTIVFNQLTANTAGGNITIHDGIHTDAVISINYEGQIDY